MTKVNLEEKRNFLIALKSKEKRDYLSSLIENNISKAAVFQAGDGVELLFKLENYPPHVCILEENLEKKSGSEVIKYLLDIKNCRDLAVILFDEIPDNELCVDEVVIGQIQFLTPTASDSLMLSTLSRSLSFVSHSDKSEYKLVFLPAKTKLFNEGDEAKCVYIVKSGSLEVYLEENQKKSRIALISSGEFVGEMAHFNGEKRSASVASLTDCELIEIPMGKLDTVLFSKPAWAKALMQTLTKRLKNANSLVKTIISKR